MIDELFEVLGRAWALYRAHFVALYSIALAIWIPCAFFDAWYVAAKPFGGDFAIFPFNRPGANFLAVLASCAILFYLREADAGRPADPAVAVKTAPRYWGPMIFTQFVLVFVLAVGFVLLIVPGVYLLVRFAAVQPAIVAEDIGFEAFRRSFELTRGKFWSVLLWIVAGTLPVLVLGFLLIFPLALFLPLHDWIGRGLLASISTLPLVFLFPLSW